MCRWDYRHDTRLELAHFHRHRSITGGKKQYKANSGQSPRGSTPPAGGSRRKEVAEHHRGIDKSNPVAAAVGKVSLLCPALPSPSLPCPTRPTCPACPALPMLPCLSFPALLCPALPCSDLPCPALPCSAETCRLQALESLPKGMRKARCTCTYTCTYTWLCADTHDECRQQLR